VAATQTLALRIIAAPRVEDLSVQSPASLAALQGQVAGDLAVFGRQLLVLVLATGGTLTSVVALADGLLRRSDLGRRRALGASRTTLIALVLIRTSIAAATGVLAGSIIGQVTGTRWASSPPTSFAAGTAVLTLLVAVAAAIGPALLAATRDPVQVLRTP
jgi:putative ABC transport system permease protein